LLHFLEHVVSTHFPHLDAFLEELQAPSEANRVNFNDMQSTSKHMLDEILNIRKSLAANFSSSEDGYTRKMFRFSAAAEEQLRDVRDGILNAEKQLRDVQNYYCEGEEMARPMQSQDFFGIFRTFTSSYKVSPVLVVINMTDPSSAALPIEHVRRKQLSENDVFKLVPPSHPRLLVNPRVGTLSKPALTDFDLKGHHASSERGDSMHPPSRPWRPIPTFPTSLFPWVKMAKTLISERLP
jgi:hypothetical protein